MSGPGKNYSIGRGELSVALSAVEGAAPLPSAMFRYLGNSPDLSQSMATTKLDHYDSDHGLKVKDDSIVLQLDRSGKFTLDSFDVENIALYFISKSQTYAQEAADAVVEQMMARPGFAGQIGTSINAMGVKGLSEISVKNHATPATVYEAGTDYVVDPASGWIKFPAGSTIPDADGVGTEIDITFSSTASSRVQIISASDAVLEGALRFRSTTPKGPAYDYFWPYVQIAPDGDLTMKGDTWLQMGFTFDILDPGDGRALMYIDGLPQTLG